MTLELILPSSPQRLDFSLGDSFSSVQERILHSNVEFYGVLRVVFSGR